MARVLLLLFLSVAFSQTAYAQDIPFYRKSTSNTYEFRASVGVKSIDAGMMILPFTPSFVGSVDAGDYLRFHVDISPISISKVPFFRGSLGTGAALNVMGRDAKKEGGLEIVVPALIELGGISGEVECGDGYYDEISWVLLGPSSGVDFTWWGEDDMGFNLSLKISHLFILSDAGSYYPEGDESTMGNKTGLTEVTLVAGIAISS